MPASACGSDSAYVWSSMCKPVLVVAGVVAASIMTASHGSWSEVEVLGASRPRRMMSLTSGLFNNGSVLVTFGGCTSSCCFAPIDSMWALSFSADGSRGEWRSIGDAKHKPSPRFGAGGVTYQEKELLMVGGQDSSQAFLNELWRYRHDNRTWERVEAEGEVPTPRAAHTTSIIQDHLVVYGGVSVSGPVGDVFVLDLASKRPEWRSLAIKGPTAPIRFHHVAIPRAGSETSIVIHGGVDERGEEHDSTFLLDLDLTEGLATFHLIAGKGASPAARHGHVATYGCGQHVVRDFAIHGGLNTLDDTLPSSVLGDSALFSVDDKSWVQADPAAGSLTKRAYATIAYGSDYCVVMGGFAGYTGDTDDRLLNDVWVYRHDVSSRRDQIGEPPAVRAYQ